MAESTVRLEAAADHDLNHVNRSCMRSRYRTCMIRPRWGVGGMPHAWFLRAVHRRGAGAQRVTSAWCIRRLTPQLSPGRPVSQRRCTPDLHLLPHRTGGQTAATKHRVNPDSHSPKATVRATHGPCDVTVDWETPGILKLLSDSRKSKTRKNITSSYVGLGLNRCSLYMLGHPAIGGRMVMSDGGP